MRNLKALGLGLGALLAMGAFGVSGAAASNGRIVSDGPMRIDGREIVHLDRFTLFGETTQCPGSTFDGEAVGGGLIASGSTTATLVRTFSGTCTTGSGLKSTVHANGCDYVLHLGETVAEEEYAATVDEVCPVNSKIDIEVFLSASNENVKACTITMGAQNGLAFLFARNSTGGFLELEGTLTSISASKEGLCGKASTTSGQFHIADELSGTNSLGGTTELLLFDQF